MAVRMNAVILVVLNWKHSVALNTMGDHWVVLDGPGENPQDWSDWQLNQRSMGLLESWCIQALAKVCQSGYWKNR